MKKLLFLCLLFFVSLTAWNALSFLTKNTSIPTVSPSPTVLGTPSSVPEDSVDLSLGETKVRVAWFLAPRDKEISLHPNFSEKLTGKEFIDENKCTYLINGGFYTEDSQPTGLFISDRIVLKGWRENDLLNGVLSINTFDTPRITRNMPKDQLVMAVQTGPMLIENDAFQRIALKTDKEARRMVAAITGENTLYFLAFYNPDSLYMGPYLEDMPGILREFEKKTKIDFADAVNLDGGSASVFLTPDVSINEYNPVGSFFCVKK